MCVREIEIERERNRERENFESVIKPNLFYGSEVWGPLTNQEFNKWEKHPIKTLNAEFCKSTLK